MKFTNNNYSVCTINEGRNSEIYHLPNGAKPIAINQNVVLYKFENQIGLMNYKNNQRMCEAISLSFKPKNIVNLDCTKSNGYNLMLVGNKSSNEFAVINITNNLIKVLFSNGMPSSLKKVFFKNQESS
jgi:hypothetical protein